MIQDAGFCYMGCNGIHQLNDGPASHPAAYTHQLGEGPHCHAELLAVESQDGGPCYCTAAAGVVAPAAAPWNRSLPSE
eukprot:1147843-Pelagomonas_calceolata.AAC.1